MNMLDYRMHYAVMAAEERNRAIQRKRRLRAQLATASSRPEPRPGARRRWSIPHLFARLVPTRGAR